MIFSNKIVHLIISLYEKCDKDRLTYVVNDIESYVSSPDFTKDKFNEILHQFRPIRLIDEGGSICECTTRFNIGMVYKNLYNDSVASIGNICVKHFENKKINSIISNIEYQIRQEFHNKPIKKPIEYYRCKYCNIVLNKSCYMEHMKQYEFRQADFNILNAFYSYIMMNQNDKCKNQKIENIHELYLRFCKNNYSLYKPLEINKYKNLIRVRVLEIKQKKQYDEQQREKREKKSKTKLNEELNNKSNQENKEEIKT